MITQLQVRRKAFAETRTVSIETPVLADGEVLLAIDKFAMTANNVSYALSGDMIGYWKFFPAEEPWGLAPVWGFADVVESRCADLPVGERVWGFLPMASHLVVSPTRVTGRSFTDGAPHRADLPGIYNTYQRTRGDPEALKALESGKAKLVGAEAKGFFDALYTITMEGFFSDPVYGGNKNKVSWSMIGFPGLPAVYADKIAKWRDKAYVAAPQSIQDFS